MQIDKLSGGYHILESGSILTYSGTDDIVFRLKMDKTFKFQVVLKFEEKEKDDQQLKFNTDSQQNIITITCVNFNNLLGTGIKKPIELATFNNKKVFINFCIYATGDEIPRKVTYTFYIQK